MCSSYVGILLVVILSNVSGERTKPNTPISVVKNCVELLDYWFKVKHIDGNICNEKNPAKLIEKVDKQLNDKNNQNALRGSDKYYYKCINSKDSDKNQRLLKIFIKCRDGVTSGPYSRILPQVGKDADDIHKGIQNSIDIFVSADQDFKRFAADYKNCIMKYIPDIKEWWEH